MPRLFDRIAEVSTDTGTGNLTLLGSITGYRAFSAKFPLDERFYYVVEHPGAGEWEIGLGKLAAANILERETVFASSNGDSFVPFSPGTKNVFHDVPAKALALDIHVPFAFGDATPKGLGVVAAGKVVQSAKVYIVTPFDGAGATLKIGDVANFARLMGTGENDPAAVGAYSTHPVWKYSEDTGIYLSINQGSGPTQGAGVAVISFEP